MNKEDILLKLVGSKVYFLVENEYETEGILASIIIKKKRYFFLIHPFISTLFSDIFLHKDVLEISVKDRIHITATKVQEEE